MSLVILLSTTHGLWPSRLLCHGVLEARILAWAVMLSSKGSSWPRDWTPCLLHILHWQAGSLPLMSPGNPNIYMYIIYIYKEVNVTKMTLLQLFLNLLFCSLVILGVAYLGLIKLKIYLQYNPMLVWLWAWPSGGVGFADCITLYLLENATLLVNDKLFLAVCSVMRLFLARLHFSFMRVLTTP